VSTATPIVDDRPAVTQDTAEESTSTTTKRPRVSLFASYNCPAMQNEQILSAISMAALITSYMDAIASYRVRTWQDIQKEGFHKLQPVIEKLFCITATSAPVERVFSHGGLFMRPHRAKMSDSVLSSLVYVKCIQAPDIMWQYRSSIRQKCVLQIYCHNIMA